MAGPAVVFDLDGVIADSAPLIAACLRSALVEHGFDEPADAEIRALVGPPIHEVVRRLTGARETVVLDACVATYRRELVGRLGETPVFPGVPELLDVLDRPLAIASSKPVEISEPQLVALGLRDRFATVEGSRLGERAVGKTEILGRALAALPGGASAMVGDRHHDIHAAHAHGLRAIGVLWGYGSEAELRAAGADAIVATPAELAAALG